MNKKVKTITSWCAVGIFLFALAINVKVTLDDPFRFISNEAIATEITGSDTATSVTKFAKKDILVGDDLVETAIIGGNTYTRTCKYKETTCTGTGSVDCTPGLYTYSCTTWEKVP